MSNRSKEEESLGHQKPATRMSDEERRELASQLDRDLEQFIENLPRRQPQDVPNFTQWEEEVVNHPFFMKDAPQPGDQLHPLYEGLQKLKYDPEENEPEELALAYKEDGNFNFKHKNYRMAVISYTEGLKAKCGDADIVATLYNNRSASQYCLKNYRSCLLDCESALKLKESYQKPLNRAANCCFILGQFDKAVEYCDKILQNNKNDKEIQTLRQKCILVMKKNARDERKKKMILKKAEEEELRVIEQIVKRNINIEGGSANLSLSRLEPGFPEQFNNTVHLDDQDCLVWPVVFLYPEYKIMEYIQDFSEKTSIMEQLQNVFSSPAGWDKDGKYKAENLNVYFEGKPDQLVKVNTEATLLEVLQSKHFVVKRGTPGFIILVKGSKAEAHFLDEYSVIQM